VAVEVDLHLQREPGLHANVQQAEVAIDEVVVQVQAFALGRLHIGLPAREAQRECAARLESREHTHQPLVDAVTLGDLAGVNYLGRRVASRRDVTERSCRS
jgi:hypothetical protein